MSLLSLLIAIIIAGGLSYIVKVLPIGQMWKVIAYVAIALFFIYWLFQQLKAAGIDMKI